MRYSHFLILIPILFSCSEIRVDPDCYPKNKIRHVAEDWKGRVSYSEELEQWFIDHYVPGTIDSYYSGLVCSMPKEYQVEGLHVIYSGNLKDHKGKIQASVVTGGQEFFFLELTGVEVYE